jgi:hypothetical protein
MWISLYNNLMWKNFGERIEMMGNKFLFGLISIILIACTGIVSATVTGPVFYDHKNVQCSDIMPGYTGMMFEAANNGVSGSFTNSTDKFHVNVLVEDSQDIIWSSNYPVDAVITKDGGNYVNYYLYDPAAISDSGLKTPFNPSGQPGAVSHLRFCYHVATTAPEFPAIALPIGMLIGLLGLVLIIRTKEL